MNLPVAAHPFCMSDTATLLLVSTEPLDALNATVTAVVLAAHPTAIAWQATSTDGASGRPGVFYWDDDVAVTVPNGRGGFDLFALSLTGTAASGALFYDLNTYRPTRGRCAPDHHQVTIERAPR